jgi:hypothetical protein
MTLDPCGIRAAVQPAHGAEIEGWQDEAQPDAPQDGPCHQQADRRSGADGHHARERGSQQRQPDAHQPAVGWRSARRPTMAMVTARTRPAGNRMVPT